MKKGEIMEIIAWVIFGVGFILTVINTFANNPNNKNTSTIKLKVIILGILIALIGIMFYIFLIYQTLEK